MTMLRTCPQTSCGVGASCCVFAHHDLVVELSLHWIHMACGVWDGRFNLLMFITTIICIHDMGLHVYNLSSNF